jgi:hypothetical protein
MKVALQQMGAKGGAPLLGTVRRRGRQAAWLSHPLLPPLVHHDALSFKSTRTTCRRFTQSHSHGAGGAADEYHIVFVSQVTLAMGSLLATLCYNLLLVPTVDVGERRGGGGTTPTTVLL